MIISVASGKGGTGKTTVAVNLAAALEKGVKILDCDVEEPNAHLFLKPDIVKTEKIFTPVPVIDKKRCTFCNKCVDICRYNAVTIIGKKVMTFPELCHSCRGCKVICPENAVTEQGRELGILESGRSEKIDFVHGRLRVGEAMVPPLIKKVISRADHNKINIIDAPPGTSCPVITAVKTSDFVLMVTEPTPFGLHDLKLGVQAVRILGIPCGLVINRSDIGSSDVREYAEKQNIPTLLEIPFKKSIAKRCSKGELIVTHTPEYIKKFLTLYSRIENEVAAEKRTRERSR